MPSKAFLKFAHELKKARKLEEVGIKLDISKFNFKNIMVHVHKSISTIEPKDSQRRYEGLGVDVLRGVASLVDKNTVSIDGNQYKTKNIVIASGSRPFIPLIEGLDKINYLTSENIFEIDTLPQTLLVIGTGPIGLELGQGFANLGSNVHMVNNQNGLFPNDDKEVGSFMLEKFKKDGIKFHMNTNVTKVEKENDFYKIYYIEDNKENTMLVDAILIATGRKPNTENLRLERLGIKTNKKGYIETDLKMRTNIKNIYACGDISGNLAFTHMARYEAIVAIRNSIFKMPYNADYTKAAWTTYTLPSITHTGLTQQQAMKNGVFKEAILLNLHETDRFIVENETDGFIKVILDKNDVLIGATIVSDNSEELIHTLTLAIKHKMKLTALGDIIVPYPMRGDILKEISLKKSKEKLTDFNKKMIQKVFLKL